LLFGRIGDNYYKRGSFAIVRSTFPVLRSTVMRDFINLLWQYGFAPYVEHKKSLNEFHYKGREVLFFSLDTPQKLRGRQNTVFWINECNDTPFEAFNQLSMRNESHCYLDYNPEGSPWVKTELEEKRLLESPEEVNLHVSTFKDNPFLPAAMVKEIENLKRTSEDLYNIYTKGIWVKRTGAIFPKVNSFEAWPVEPPDFQGWGLDFGWTDPSCLVEVRIYGKKLYIKELFYKENMLLSEISQAIYAQGAGIVVCDSADPRSIDELRRRGNRVRPSLKGYDSIVQGINRILQHEIYLSGENVSKEFKAYSWKKGQLGEILPIPEDKNNHSPDSTRYALSYSMAAKMRLI
jgi:phage terminase large subunit